MRYKIKLTRKRWSHPKQRKMRTDLKPGKPEHWLWDGIGVVCGEIEKTVERHCSGEERQLKGESVSWNLHGKCKEGGKRWRLMVIEKPKGHKIRKLTNPSFLTPPIKKTTRRYQLRGWSRTEKASELSKLLSPRSHLAQKNISILKRDRRGAWVAQLVRCLTPAQDMVSRFVGSSPMSGSVLTAWSLEPASDSVSLFFSTRPLLALCLSFKNE